MDYADLEVIVVNDRSVDQTGVVLEQMQKQYPGLQIHDISVLPEGWLGKNHALQYGEMVYLPDLSGRASI
jgi:glycosyltransferase involved in cell wall biosynthesis